MRDYKTKYMIFASFFSMLIMAITDSTKGILIPTFKDVFQVSDTTIGTFLMLGSLSYVGSTYLGSLLCARYGQKKIIMSGMLTAGSAFLATSFAQNFNQIMLGYIIITLGIAFIAIGMNTLIPLVKVTYLALLMNLLHFFYGLGSTLTQRVTGALLYRGIEWRSIFAFYFILYLISFAAYAFVKAPKDTSDHTADRKGMIPDMGLMILFCLSLGFYVAAEIQTSNWLLNYLNSALGMNINTGSFYVAFFFGVFSIGRLLGGLVAEKFGYLRSVTASLTLALVMYVSGLLAGERGMVLVSLSGLFFAINFPTLLLLIQKTFPKNGTYIAGIATMSASVISMVIGYLMGVFNDMVGAGATIFMIPACLGISLGLTLLISVKIKSKSADTHQAVCKSV